MELGGVIYKSVKTGCFFYSRLLSCIASASEFLIRRSIPGLAKYFKKLKNEAHKKGRIAHEEFLNNFLFKNKIFEIEITNALNFIIKMINFT